MNQGGPKLPNSKMRMNWINPRRKGGVYTLTERGDLQPWARRGRGRAKTESRMRKNRKSLEAASLPFNLENAAEAVNRACGYVEEAGYDEPLDLISVYNLLVLCERLGQSSAEYAPLFEKLLFAIDLNITLEAFPAESWHLDVFEREMLGHTMAHIFYRRNEAEWNAGYNLIVEIAYLALGYRKFFAYLDHWIQVELRSYADYMYMRDVLDFVVYRGVELQSLRVSYRAEGEWILAQVRNFQSQLEQKREELNIGINEL